MIIVDTGYWLALANEKDRHHQRALAWLHALPEPLITTWPVVTETSHLLSRRIGIRSQTTFLLSLADGASEVFDVHLVHMPRLVELMEKYRDLPMDLADASLVLLAEQLEHGRILSTDQRDFRTYRWKQREPFHNLMLDEPHDYRLK
ncbi:MAG: PIN domain-containing protein [Acidobacteriota bacterium]